MSTIQDQNHPLLELKGSNYEISDGQPDITNWIIKDGKGSKIGKVKNLLFDETSHRVRYIIADLQAVNVINKTVLIPIGIAQLHEQSDEVILPVHVATISLFPNYEQGHVTPQVENNIKSILSKSKEAAPLTEWMYVEDNSVSNNDAFYDHDYYNEKNLYKNRENRLKGS